MASFSDQNINKGRLDFIIRQRAIIISGSTIFFKCCQIHFLNRCKVEIFTEERNYTNFVNLIKQQCQALCTQSLTQISMYIFFQQVKNIHLFLNNNKLFEERSPNNKDKKILLKISFEKMTLQKNLRLIKNSANKYYNIP